MSAPTPTAPLDFESLRAAIRDQRDTLPKRLMQVAAYALEHPDEVAFGTTASIAAAAQVQPSTLVRFAQNFGFDGFSGLQLLFQARLKGRNSSYEDRLRQLESGGASETESSTILKGFVSAAHQSLDALSQAIDPAQLERAIDLLARAETIYLIARRRSFPIVTSMAYAFGKLKVRCQVVSSAAGNDDDLLALATPKDAAFAVSFSPYAAESAAQAQVLAHRGVPLVALTDSVLSPLATSANVWFELVEADHGGFRSLSASVAFAMALTVSVAERRRQL
ncbi:MurR/RpiR family transcriptional regulator [Devosia sp. XJ19-1]|uniref:MurR/RpiR family transcriptional regulator n=1 Tax=Devosia ureilytica TaxID=2952754 RepID=A0A9Q4FQY6_9HYPH|nr:MurR/RpiR family transcriptional regulator [Devosia ureilytica]MCP8882491.1 MurR/RpiR family transcriptional regulator [Devosia ureilytica]MCP8885622.1 MurR/RpiR family transcriptional regulator [Devosia ureilytica]